MGHKAFGAQQNWNMLQGEICLTYFLLAAPLELCVLPLSNQAANRKCVRQISPCSMFQFCGAPQPLSPTRASCPASCLGALACIRRKPFGLLAQCAAARAIKSNGFCGSWVAAAGQLANRECPGGQMLCVLI